LSDKKEVSAKFKAALKSEIAKRTTPNAALTILLDHTEVIREAREHKISHTKISEILSDAGVPATQDLIRKFCLKYLKEIPVSRKKRRKPRTPKPMRKADEAKTKPKIVTLDNQATRTSKKGFRVASGEL
jgi:hypothetical protein